MRPRLGSPTEKAFRASIWPASLIIDSVSQTERAGRGLDQRLGTTLASLAERLASVKGGRLILALGTGALSAIPVAGTAVGAAGLEYRNLYAAALTNERVAQLAERVEEVSRALQEHDSQLDLLFEMIVGVCELLDYSLGSAVSSKVDDLDQVADTLFRPDPRYVNPTQSSVDHLQTLLDERNYAQLLNLLDDLPDLPSERYRLLRTKALYGLESFDELYVLLRKVPLNNLSQEELEAFVWSCLELGNTVDAARALRHHEANLAAPAAKLFRLSARARFAGRTVAQKG